MKTKFIKVDFRGCEHVGVINVDALTEGIKTKEGNLVPGLEDTIAYFTSDTDPLEWMEVFHQKHPGHKAWFTEEA